VIFSNPGLCVGSQSGTAFHDSATVQTFKEAESTVLQYTVVGS